MDMSLEEWFESGQNGYFSVVDSKKSMNDPELQATVKSAMMALMRASVAIARGDVFSSNENKDDVATDRLLYVLTDFYLGELYLKLVTPMDKRLGALKSACDRLTRFLNLCDQLELLTKEERGQYKEEEGGEPLNPERKRAMKAKRFLETKEQREALENLKEKLKAKEKKKEMGRANEDSDDTEELTREHGFVLIRLGILQSLESLDMSKRELEMLEMMEAMNKARASKPQEEQDRIRDLEARKKQQDHEHQLKTREELTGIARALGSATEKFPLPSSSSPGLSPGGLIGMDGVGRKNGMQVTSGSNVPLSSLNEKTYRQQLQEKVFQPGYRQATRSIEWAAEQEMKMAVRGGGNAEHVETDKDDIEIEIYDKNQVYKDREWDDWKDDNPRGAGNTGYNRG